MQLRKCCNHPFLFPGVEPSADEAYSQQLIDGSVRATAAAPPPRLRAFALPPLYALAPLRLRAPASLHPYTPVLHAFLHLHPCTPAPLQGKFQLLERLLAKLFSGGHRVVLFSQFTSTLDLLEDFLTHKEYKYCRLDGSTNRVQRTVDINSFNMPGSSRFVFLMSTRAGGLGINCQTADTW